MVTRESEFHIMYMNIAKEVSALSRANRKKVGCVAVKNDSIISYGFNGTPFGYFTNICEEDNKTIDAVVHAEQNCLMKIAASTSSSENCILYMTMKPCINCSKLIVQAKIKAVYFDEEYREEDGLKLLKDSGIDCYKINNGIIAKV